MSEVRLNNKRNRIVHEMSLFRDLMEKLNQVALENPGKRITKVKVVLGALSHLSESHFQFHFDELSRGTPIEGAMVDIEEDTDKEAPHAQSVVLTSVDFEI